MLDLTSLALGVGVSLIIVMLASTHSTAFYQAIRQSQLEMRRKLDSSSFIISSGKNYRFDFLFVTDRASELLDLLVRREISVDRENPYRRALYCDFSVLRFVIHQDVVTLKK